MRIKLASGQAFVVSLVLIPVMTKEFLAMGVDELSVSAGSILPIRKIILETDLSQYGKDIK